MSISLDRNVIIDIDLGNGKITKPNNASYYNTDSNIAFFYVKLHKTATNGVTEYIQKQDANNYKVEMKIVKPKSFNTKSLVSTLSNDLVEENCALYKFTIDNSLMNEVGEPFCYISIIYNDQKLVTDGFTYTIKQDPLGEYNAILLNDPDMPLLLKLIETIQNQYENIDDINIRDDKTFSSHKIIQLLERKVDIDQNDFATKTELTENISKKQDKLVSGTNIKTINGESLLGNGNIAITGGSSTGGTTETYGIIADGVTDNSNAIRTALRSTKYLILPRGKIYLASTIEIDSETTITSEGETEIITNGNPAFSCNGILNENTTPNTVAFKHDITISNLTFTFKSEAETSALRFNSVNNVNVFNCTTTNISLITLSTAFVNAELVNPDYDTVAAGGIVNEDCLSNNIRIANNTIYGTNGNTRTVGIVVCYCKNVIITRNIIRNAVDGIRIWGGNIGDGCYNRDEMERYCKYITVSNNIVENTIGGIWAGRGSYITFTGNTVNKCTDVGLDFEGCYSCTAVGNIVNDCINGCMGTMFSAKKISFIGNTCTDTGALDQGTFMFVHSNNPSMKTEVYFANNTFTSKIRMLGSSFLDSVDGSIVIENNIFNNATLGLHLSAYTRIKNNSFWVDPTLSTDYWQKHDAPIINITLMSSGTNPEGLHRYNYEIIGNIFKNDTPTGLNDSRVTNKAISITGAAWRQSMRVLIKDNKITGFKTCLAHKATADNLNCETMLFIELINNLFSGDVINEGVNSYNRIFYEGNKKINESANIYLDGPSLSNYPNAIPQTSGKNNAFWVKGTKIYFDVPDSNGYTGAICTVGGDPGTWKRFGKIS